MKSRNNRGFTLMELMIVVAIMGIGVTMAVTSYYKYLPHIRLKAAARDISTSLNITRMKAIALNSSKTLTFNVNTDSFTNDFNDPVSTSLNRGWNKMVDLWWGGGGNKYVLVPAFTGAAVTYSSYGAPSNLDGANTDYAIYLRNKPVSTGEEYRVRVNRLTGKVTVERWNGVDTWVD